MNWNKSIVCRYPLIYVAWDSGAMWPDTTSIKLRIMDFAGAPVMPQNATVFSGTNGQAQVEMVDANGTGLLFSCRQSFASQYNFYAQKYNYSGQRLWDQDVLVRSVDLIYQCMYSNDFGGAIFSWCEIDPLYGQLICAAMVNAQGELGVVGVAEDQHEALITCFSLLPCFPNPFNATTTLCFTLPAPSCVVLDVFDTAGRAVGERQEGWYGAGVHHILFDGSDLPSGLYLARLWAGSHQAVRKLVLIK